MKFIKIVKTPAGPAPLHIREAWIGVTLPLRWPGVRRLSANKVFRPFSVFLIIKDLLQGNFYKVNGYVVLSGQAIDILEKSAPEAAAWWRENVPYAIRPERVFIFDEESCEPLDEDQLPESSRN